MDVRLEKPTNGRKACTRKQYHDTEETGRSGRRVGRRTSVRALGGWLRP